MENKFESIDNLESSIRKTSVIKERIGLVATHMYKQYLEYEESVMNTKEIFLRVMENTHTTIEDLKMSFSSRGIMTKNIHYEMEQAKSTIVLTILWHTISLVLVNNEKPQALYRETEAPFFAGRIMALNGNYAHIMREHAGNEMQGLLEHEVASLFVPAEKGTPTVMKIKHLGSRELYLSHIDAPKEFLLKVIEIICGGGLYHEENQKKG